MTAHELARKLLEGPDHAVCFLQPEQIEWEGVRKVKELSNSVYNKRWLVPSKKGPIIILE